MLRSTESSHFIFEGFGPDAQRGIVDPQDCSAVLEMEGIETAHWDVVLASRQLEEMMTQWNWKQIYLCHFCVSVPVLCEKVVAHYTHGLNFEPPFLSLL